MKVNEFGGAWTQVKLAILNSYLNSYSTALKHKFTLHYADAFAGTGSHKPKTAEGQVELIPLEAMKGSVQIALDINKFDLYHFNDLSPENYSALQEIEKNNPEKKICISNLDANCFIKNFCLSLDKGHRAVLFVDPFATDLTWHTLETIAYSRQIDLWLLFPFSSLNRMMPKLGSNPLWEKKVSDMLGDTDWKIHIYKKVPMPATEDMFGGSEENDIERIDQKAISLYVTDRLRSIFPYASEPLPLKNSKGSTLFLLYFSISNQSTKAIALAKRISGNILKQPAQLG